MSVRRRVEPSTPPRTRSERSAADYPQAEVQNRDEFVEAALANLKTILNLIYALLAFAVFIALLGIANTLALSIFERTRELGLLRAVGMTAAQLRATVRWEATIIALLGTTLGLTIGTGFGWAIVRALRDEGIGEFTIPFGQLAVITAIAAGAGVAAAVLPARRPPSSTYWGPSPASDFATLRLARRRPAPAGRCRASGFRSLNSTSAPRQLERSLALMSALFVVHRLTREPADAPCQGNEGGHAQGGVIHSNPFKGAQP